MPNDPVGYIGNSVGCVLCASVKESMRTAVRFPKVAYFRDLNIRHDQTLNGVASIQTDDRWRSISSAQGRGHVLYGRYIKYQ